MVRDAVQASIRTKQVLQEKCVQDVVGASEIIGSAIRGGHKVLLLGNGGSAADAQHIAAELVGRFKGSRPPLKAIALTTNSSILTAIGNDFGFDEVFARQVISNAEADDVVIGISTSGKSPNVIKAVQEAHRIGAKTIGLTGADGKQLAQICDASIMVPSDDTQRIQESHIMIGHILCELLEADLFPSKK
jgi:D-sedoheptulose 7-phosphate isomerase